jgi:hypothetical protein
MNRLLTILLLAAGTAYGQIDNPPTSVNIVDSTATGRAVLTATNAAAAATAVGLGTTNAVSFDSLTIGALSGDPLNVDFYQIESPSFNFFFDWEERRLAQGGNTIFSWNSTNASFAVPVSFATNVTVGGTLAATGNVTLSGVNNTATAQTASSASSLMTRGLSDARLSPMPMTPQIIPWFYNGTLNVTRVTNGSATLGTLAAYPNISVSTNAGDSGAMIMIGDVWGAVDSAANPWNAVGKSVIIQGRLASTSSNAVARFVWSSSTNWPTIMTNLGTNGISNLGWAVETRNSGGSNEARLIVNGSTNKSESAWTVIGYNPGNDSSFMVVPRVGSTSLYWAQESSTFSRTPLITVTNQIGGSLAAAFTGGLGFAVINTNTPAGSSSAYIRRCYQVLGMTNYGY